MGSAVRRIDIKEGYPPVDVAIFLLEREIEMGKLEGIKVLKVIHGYGSNGKGGLIKKQVKVFLKEQKRLGKITDYVHGEGWSNHKVKPMGLLGVAPELLLNLDGEQYNMGITIVIL
jgi:hypothetical protein